jgi:hypothetical protein
VQALEKLRIGVGAALEISWQIRLESVVVGTLTLVTRSQWILFPGESLLVGEELKESLARGIATGSGGRRSSADAGVGRGCSHRGGRFHVGHGRESGHAIILVLFLEGDSGSICGSVAISRGLDYCTPV